MSASEVVLYGGTRASRGRFPKLRFMQRSRVFLLWVPGLRLRLEWTPWRGYQAVAWARVVRGKVVTFGYYI